MREVGKVTKTDGDYATVRVDKKDECSKCGLCLFPKNAAYTEFRAKNGCGAQVGDEVMVENEGGGKLISSLLVFFIPLLLIAAATVISVVIIKKEIWILLLSLIFIVLWYTVLGVFDKILRKNDKFCATIVEVLPKGDTKNDKNNEQDGVL